MRDDRFADLFLGHAVGPPEAAGSGHSPALGGGCAAQWNCHGYSLVCLQNRP